MITIVSNGYWTRYTPEVWPEGLPPNIAFCRRESDGKDFYEFQRERGFSDESVKLLVVEEAPGTWRVQVATVDGSRLFPANCEVLEVYDGNLEAPESIYVGKVYNTASNALLDYVVPTFIPTEASKLGLRRVFLEQGIWPEVKAMIAADENMQEEWDLAVVIKRSDALVQAMITSMGLSEAQVDAIMTRQAQLV